MIKTFAGGCRGDGSLGPLFVRVEPRELSLGGIFQKWEPFQILFVLKE